MTAEEFDGVFNLTIDLSEQVLTQRAPEYSTKEDRMHNFHEAQLLLRPTKVITPAIAAWGIASKQAVCVIDQIYMHDKSPSIGMIEEKFGDLINYLILIKAMLIEQHGHKQAYLKQLPLSKPF